MPDTSRPDLDSAYAAGQDLHSELTELEQAAGLAITGTAGVAGIEPTFHQAVRHVRRVARRTVGADQPHPASDGVHLTHHDNRIDVSVDIAVTATYSALDTAQRVRNNLTASITELGHQPGTIEVTVLSLHPADSS